MVGKKTREQGSEMTWKAAGEVGMGTFWAQRQSTREQEAVWQLHWMEVRAVWGMEESFCLTVITALFCLTSQG